MNIPIVRIIFSNKLETNLIYFLLITFFVLYVSYFSQFVHFVFAATATSINMWLNNTLNSNLTLNSPSASNATANATPAGIRITLQRNGTIVATGTNIVSEISQLPAGVYNYTANFSGNATYSPSSRTQFLTITIPPPASNTITFYYGWNLISFTVLSVTSISSDNCALSSNTFYYYNGQTKTWELNKYNQLVGGKGYWVFSDSVSACTTSFGGSGPIGATDLPPLKTGYNLVGTKSTVPYQFSSTVDGCSVSVGPMYWDNRPASQGGQSWTTVSSFDANRGYWVYVTSDCSFT